MDGERGERRGENQHKRGNARRDEGKIEQVKKREQDPERERERENVKEEGQLMEPVFFLSP
jgi:hypothetical protein